MVLLGTHHARQRHLWSRRADTIEGNRILEEVRRLSCLKQNEHLTDGQLIRLAYWGVPGDA